MLRRRRLLLRAAADLVERRHDLRRRPVDLLDRARQLLGSRGNLLGAFADIGAVLELVGDFGQFLRRLLALAQRGGLLLDGIGGFLAGRALFLGSGGDHFGALLRFLCGGGGFVIRPGNRDTTIGHFDQGRTDLVELAGDGGALLDFLFGGLRRVADAVGDHLHLVLDLGDQVLDFARGFLRGLGKRADLIGDHGESLAVLAGAGGFDGGVQGQQVGLVGDARDRLHHVTDAGGLGLQILHAPYRRVLPLGRTADGPQRCGDLGGDIADQCLQPLGPLQRGVGILLGLDDQGAAMRHRLQRLRRRVRRLLRPGGDLRRRALQLGRGGACLGDAARELRSGGGHPFGGLLLTGEGARLALLRVGQQPRCGRQAGPLGQVDNISGRLGRDASFLYEGHDGSGQCGWW